MELNDLTEGQKAKIRGCGSAEELASLAEEEGIELTDEQLSAVSGGSWNSADFPKCPKCNSEDIYKDRNTGVWHCRACGHTW